MSGGGYLAFLHLEDGVSAVTLPLCACVGVRGYSLSLVVWIAAVVTHLPEVVGLSTAQGGVWGVYINGVDVWCGVEGYIA